MTDDVFLESQNIVVPTTYIIHNGRILFKSCNFFLNAKTDRAIYVQLQPRVSMEIRTPHYI